MAIRLQNLYKAYGERVVLRDVSLAMEEGRRYCLMGPSGSGKTTLLHILMGLVPADSGSVSGLADKRLAPVFQDDRLCENLSAGANIRMAARNALSPAEVAQALERLDLPGCLRKPVRELSGGMKRRVAIARALLSGGEVFLMDEPFKGLDDDTKQAVIAYTGEMCAGKTVIWVTHDEREAALFGDETIRLPL